MKALQIAVATVLLIGHVSAQPQLQLLFPKDSVIITNTTGTDIALISLRLEAAEHEFTRRFDTTLAPDEEIRRSRKEWWSHESFLDTAKIYFSSTGIPDTALLTVMLPDTLVLLEAHARSHDGYLMFVDRILVRGDTLIKAPYGPLARAMKRKGWPVRDGLVLKPENNLNYVKPPRVTVSKGGRLTIHNRDHRYWTYCRTLLDHGKDVMYVRLDDGVTFIDGKSEKSFNVRDWARTDGKKIYRYKKGWMPTEITLHFEVSDGRSFSAELKPVKKGVYEPLRKLLEVDGFDK